MKDVHITQWLVLRNNPIPLDPNKRYTFTPKLAGNTFEGLMLYTYDEKGVGTYTGSNIPARSTGVSVYYQKKFRFLYKGIIIKHNKTEPTYTKTSLFLCEKRRFFMARTEKGVVTTI